MPSKKVRARLVGALQAQSLVRVERKPRYADQICGVVLRVGSKWALMAQTADGGHFDGLVAFRLKDVKRVSDDKTVATAFAETTPEWPPSYTPDLDLDTTAGVLSGLGEPRRLVGIEKEAERSALWIGILYEITRRFVYLHEVRPDGTWHAQPLGYTLRAITKVEIGTRYFSALSAVAGDGPEVEVD